ncbi:hypothetical protein Cgig2_022578 [Carnegiea gigantea]|uniref:Uncharacterized protein n=1 Tax=Carnegiea gigantea TaxID=171969 RepID=A0A9Q1KKK3_9CARY|nr:hypothetical protein Cgig2_022578 [Carnegiea gigantea]
MGSSPQCLLKDKLGRIRPLENKLMLILSTFANLFRLRSRVSAAGRSCSDSSIRIKPLHAQDTNVRRASLPSDESHPAQWREREGERGSRSLIGHRGLGFEHGLRKPPTPHSPAAGCSLLGFSHASVPVPVGSLCAGISVVSDRSLAGVSPDFRRRTVSDSLFQGQPGSGVGFDDVNSDEPFPPWVGVLLSPFHPVLI